MPEFTDEEGNEFPVTTLSCGACKNYWWVKKEHMEFEIPSFCPWCGNHFETATHTDEPIQG